MSYELTNEQKILLNNSFNDFRDLCNDLKELMNKLFQEKIKPIIDRIKESLKNKLKLKIEYKLIKTINVNSYFGLNKPRIIHCRNNC